MALGDLPSITSHVSLVSFAEGVIDLDISIQLIPA